MAPTLLVVAVIGLLAARAKTPAKPSPSHERPVSYWVAELGHKQVARRFIAARALGRLGPRAKDAVPALTAVLKDKELRVREAACLALVQIDPCPRTAMLMFDLKLDPFALHSGMILPDFEEFLVSEALRTTGEEGIRQLCAYLKEDDPKTRVRAVTCLAALMSRASSAVPDLVEVTEDPNSDVRSAAVDALCKIGRQPELVVPAVCAVYERDGHPYDLTKLARFGPKAKMAVPLLARLVWPHRWFVSHSAAEALGQIGPEAREAVPALRRALRSRDSMLRAAALRGLSGIGPDAREAVPEICLELKDTTIYNRSLAATALGRIGPGAKAAVEPLYDALTYRTSPIRFEAAQALARIGAESVPFFQKALSSPNADIRRLAVVSLSTMGEVAQPAVPALCDCTRDPDDLVRLSAVESLARLGTVAREAIPTLRELLLGKESGLRAPAAEALGRIGAEGVPALLQALNHRDRRVRLAAIAALGEMGPLARSAVPALKGASKDEDPEVRTVAADCLKRVAGATSSCPRP